jgi:hypothetical protein
MDAVAEEWKDVRETILGSPDKPLHFADLRRHLGPINRQNLLANFFDKADVGRIGVCITEEEGFDLCSESGKLLVRAAFDELLFQQAKIIERQFEKIIVVFEDSTIMKHVYKLCAGLTLERSDGHEVPVLFRWVTKSAAIPFMEIADAIAHTLAGNIRSRGGNPKFQKRSSAIFSPANNAPAIARHLIAKFTPSNSELKMSLTESS